jgi:hypothetical protein
MQLKLSGAKDLSVGIMIKWNPEEFKKSMPLIPATTHLDRQLDVLVVSNT